MSKKYKDYYFEITANVNCPDEIGFLKFKMPYPYGDRCVGGFDLKDGVYEVCIDKPMDENGSDSLLVGTVGTIEEAKALLWEHRNSAEGTDKW